MNIESIYKVFKQANKSVSIFSIVTETGIELFNGENKKNHNISVLVSAIVSATNSLQDNLGHNRINRFSISNSSQGYLIENVEVNQRKCIAFLAYQNEINPAKLTWEFRKFTDSINGLDVLAIKQISKKDKYLFDHITDDEIDRLFFSVEV
jgi:hypothetical protein